MVYCDGSIEKYLKDDPDSVEISATTFFTFKPNQKICSWYEDEQIHFSVNDEIVYIQDISFDDWSKMYPAFDIRGSVCVIDMIFE